MFHSDVAKYLNYTIQILERLIETSMSHSNSDTFLQTVLQPRKLRRLDFRSAEQTIVLIQFMVIDFDKFLLSDIRYSQPWIKHIAFSSNATVNWKYQRCERSVANLEHPFVARYFSHVHSLHGLVAEICLDIYRRLGQIPLCRKMPVDLYSKTLVLWCQVLPHLIDLLFFHVVLLQIKVIILALSLYLCKLLILFLQWDHVNRYVWCSQNHLFYNSCCAKCWIYFHMDKMLEDLRFPKHIVT